MPCSGSRRRAAAALLCLALGALPAGALLAQQNSGPRAAPPRAPAPAAGVVNINTAGLEELQRLPGIGPARARAILEHRRAHGVFLSVEELTRVPGIGPRSLERLRPLCVLSGPTTARPPRRVGRSRRKRPTRERGRARE